MMDNNAVVSPLILLNVFHMHFPRFAETTENGALMQHDASECWTEMMRSLQRDLNLDEYKSVGPENEARSAKYNFIEHYFEGQFQVKLKNTESEEEEETKSSERFLQLSCFISHDVKYLQSGLKSKLEESITKYSNVLKKDCVYLKKSLLNRLPSHLTVQIMRFEFKEKKSNCAKILKEIKFTLNLDVFELCTPELQTKLMVMRSKFKEEEDRRMEKAQNLDKEKALSHEEGSSKDEEGKSKGYRYPYSFSDDPGSNNSGYYELEAVLTHKGREGSSGHYVAWVRRNKGTFYSNSLFFCIII
jgi:PREDICTED: similar to ubiquitin carboxyl-terminal hydrolase 14 (ubiquitin thioesterase 14) (ubiquitin-specific-processing protease 14) (deubiquitinating enzyme 14), partial